MMPRPPAAALLLALHLTGCVTWQATTTPLPDLTSGDKPPASVRVTTVTGEQLEVMEPRVHLDSLIGGSKPDTGWVFLALADIDRVEVLKRNVLKTAAGVAFVVGLAWLIAEVCDEPDKCTTEDE
ncbi:MAG TPA: hypothetical protein PK948_02805 [Gemmatimonadales bacterium]|jgi:hypothetical protein|nr:hypothetical protein [Gemmatimonadales bacterium]